MLILDTRYGAILLDVDDNIRAAAQRVLGRRCLELMSGVILYEVNEGKSCVALWDPTNAC